MPPAHPPIAYVLPTRDRPARVHQTLARLSQLGPHDAQVIVVDNASTPPLALPSALASGVPIRLARLETNASASARNIAANAADPRARWLVMLDDDSYPLDTGFLTALAEAPPQVHAIAGEIFLHPDMLHPDMSIPGAPATRRELGGLPEVFTGCGAAIRAEVFRDLGGYDPSFDYYAEEYDLCARIILSGGWVRFDRRLRVQHDRDTAHRQPDRIFRNLVRNNAWISARYAPDHLREAEIARHLERYRHIAQQRGAQVGFTRGLEDLQTTLATQPRRPMSPEHWDRFTGAAACRDFLRTRRDLLTNTLVHLVHPGKNAHIVEAVLTELGVQPVHQPAEDGVTIIANLSPGPCLDALDQERARTRALGLSRVILPPAGFEDPSPHPGDGVLVVPGACEQTA